VDDVRRAFGRRLRALRHTRALSQEALAERASLHWTYVGGIERGERNPSLDNINRLARALNVTLADLFGPFKQGLPARPKALRRRQAAPTPAKSR